MSNSIEMDDLPRLRGSKSTSAEPPLRVVYDLSDPRTSQPANADDGSISVWAWTSALMFVTVLRFPHARSWSVLT
jgi:hypothetical protein